MKQFLKTIPISLRDANAFISKYHRHHGKVQGCKFCIGCSDDDGVLHGIAIIGRPVSRYLDDGKTAEVTRLCTDGYQNACSYLYGASARIAKQMGYVRIITYILESENGISLAASGWVNEGIAGGGNWNVKSRPRNDSINCCRKQRFTKNL